MVNCHPDVSKDMNGKQVLRTACRDMCVQCCANMYVCLLQQVAQIKDRHADMCKDMINTSPSCYHILVILLAHSVLCYSKLLT